jgi:hypothetical protein
LLAYQLFYFVIPSNARNLLFFGGHIKRKVPPLRSLTLAPVGMTVF